MHLIGRRNFLTGLGLGVGAPLLGAMFRQMLPEALGQTVAKKRFYLYFNRFGVNDSPQTKEAYFPAYFPQPGPTESTFTLGEGWSPLERYRNELLIMRGFYNPYNRDLHGNTWSLAVTKQLGSAGPNVDGRGLPSVPGGITLDRQLAATIGKDDLNPSVFLISVQKFICLSADGPSRPFPGMPNPIKAYETLFAAGVPMAGPSPAERLAREQSLLDLLKGDVARMSSRVSGPEKEKLDQYLESVRGMERKLAALVKTAGSCAAMVIDPALDRTHKAEDVPPELIAANMEIGINALVCGLTRVVAHAFGYDCKYSFLGFEGRIGNHGMWHGGPAAWHHKVYAYHAANMALVRECLGAFREGDGTMADRFLMMIFNEGGGFHHEGHDRLWVMLLGSAGGYFKTGRYLTFPKMTRCVSDAFVSVLNGMGVATDTFGNPESCKGPLPGLT